MTFIKHLLRVRPTIHFTPCSTQGNPPQKRQVICPELNSMEERKPGFEPGMPGSLKLGS